MSDNSVVQYVSTSSVRSDILSGICDCRKETDDLLAALDASESAVYEALSNLERRGLVTSTAEGWRLTGTGRLVTDAIDRQRETERLIEAAPKYWENHDTSLLPRRFRCRLRELDEYEIVRGTQTDINRPVREVVTRVESADGCDVVSPVYHEEYEEAMPDNADSRLVLSCDVVDEVRESPAIEQRTETYEQTSVRVTPIAYALGVADEWMILTLPDLSGQWPTAKVVSENGSAISWAEELFESIWEDAVPIETYLSDI